MFGVGKRLTYQVAGMTALFVFFLFLPGKIVSAAENLPQKGLQGTYGEKKKIATAEDAQKALQQYFSKKDVIVGEIMEKELYFEAEIKDKKNGTVIDKMIVDKRTGRIRSVY